jgi:hypothetical protein
MIVLNCCVALQEFDAVVVANGHYSEPNLPDVAGADAWPGLQLHSHNYRTPEVFRDQVVVVVGASNSGWRKVAFWVGGGLQLHSHNYRTPEVFRDQVVVVVGASNSGWCEVAFWVGGGLQLHSHNCRTTGLPRRLRQSGRCGGSFKLT